VPEKKGQRQFNEHTLDRFLLPTSKATKTLTVTKEHMRNQKRTAMKGFMGANASSFCPGEKLKLIRLQMRVFS